jgi:hypothetical protein
VVLSSCSNLATKQRKRVMPWMCLERCGENASAIARDLKQLGEHASLLYAVSFEAYNLGPNGQLIRNNLTQVSKHISALGLKTFPMISSYPYPPQFLDWMRQLFAQPEAFIDNAVRTALKEGYSGWNVDWEPTAKASAEDAANYAVFLDRFGKALHKVKLQLTVDIASWNSIWNLTLLAKTKNVDRLITMSTYATSFKTFKAMLDQQIAIIGPERLGVGLMTINDDTHKWFTDAELAERFKEIADKAAQEVDLWLTPIPDHMWKYIDSWVHSTPTDHN